MHCIEVTLEPGEETSLNFVLGYVENPEDEKWESPGVINKKLVHAMIAQFADEADVERALSELRAYWNNLLSKYTIQSHDDKLNRM